MPQKHGFAPILIILVLFFVGLLAFSFRTSLTRQIQPTASLSPTLIPAPSPSPTPSTDKLLSQPEIYISKNSSEPQISLIPPAGWKKTITNKKNNDFEDVIYIAPYEDSYRIPAGNAIYSPTIQIGSVKATGNLNQAVAAFIKTAKNVHKYVTGLNQSPVFVNGLKGIALEIKLSSRQEINTHSLVYFFTKDNYWVVVIGTSIETNWNKRQEILKNSLNTITLPQSDADAVTAVKNLPEVKKFLNSIPNSRIDLDSDDSDSNVYLVHVYEIKDGHTATFNWYEVNKSTGEIKKQF